MEIYTTLLRIFHGIKELLQQRHLKLSLFVSTFSLSSNSISFPFMKWKRNFNFEPFFPINHALFQIEFKESLNVNKEGLGERKRLRLLKIRTLSMIRIISL